MRQNKISPLEQLRKEKEMLRRECRDGEERLAQRWSYLSGNMTSILFATALNSVRSHLGFGSSKKSDDKDAEQSSGGNSLTQGLLSGVLAASPLLFEMLQPMLFSFVIKKIKSLFTSKKKKKNNRRRVEDEDDD